MYGSGSISTLCTTVYTTANMTEADVERADDGEHECRRAQQPAGGEFHVAAPVAAAAPPRPRAGHVRPRRCARVHERADPQRGQAEDAAATQRVARAVAIGLDDGGRPCRREKSGGYRRCSSRNQRSDTIDEAIADHDFAPFESRPPEARGPRQGFQPPRFRAAPRAGRHSVMR